MNFILKYSPSFLKEIDRRLRVKYPWIWSTRIHITLFLGLIMGVLFTLFGFVYYLDIYDLPWSSSREELFNLLLILSIVWTLFNIYQLALFNGDKTYGKVFFGKGMLLFIIYFFTFLIPLIIPYSTTFVINRRMANLLTQQELEQKLDEFNYGRIYFPTTKGDYRYYKSDSAYVFNMTRNEKEIPVYLPLASKQPRSLDEIKIINVLKDSIKAYYNRMEDQEEEIYEYDYEYNNNERDISGNIKDSIYLGSKILQGRKIKLYPTHDHYDVNYRYQDRYMPDADLNEKLRDFIFRRNLDRDESIAREKIVAFINLLNEFSATRRTIDPELVLKDYRDHAFEGSYTDRNVYDMKDDVDDALSLIAGAKVFEEDMFEPAVFIAIGIIMFCLAGLFSIFKSVTWQQMLIGFAAFFVIGVLIGIASAVTRDEEEVFLTLTLIMSLVVMFISFRTFSLEKRNHVVIQATILFNMVAPFFPVIILFFMQELLDFFHWDMFDGYLESMGDRDYCGQSKFVNGVEMCYSDDYRDMKTAVRLSAFFGGLGFYFLVLHEYFRAAYLRHWALPKTK